MGLALAFLPDNFLVDDAFISFRYAANLAAGRGLVYNPGERVEGYTNFLWTLILAGAGRAGFDIPAAALVLGMLFSFGAVGVLLLIGRETLAGCPPLLQVLPALLLASNRSFWLWAVSGMETNLFVFLVLLAILLFLRPPTPAGLAAGALSAVAAALTRPEGVMVFCLLAAWRLLAGPGPVPRRALLLAAGIFMACMLAYAGWKMLYFGDLLPNTFYAKNVGTASLVNPGVLYLTRFVIDGAAGLLPLGLLLAPLAARPGAPRRKVVLVTLVGAIYATYVMFVGGDIYYHNRFLMPVLPLVYVGAVVTALALDELTLNRTRLRRGVLAVAVIICLQLASTLLAERRFSPVVDYDRTANAYRELISSWFRHLPPATVFASVSAGIIPYRTGFTMIDLVGLTDRVIGRGSANWRRGPLAHQKSDTAYVLSRKPDFVEFSIIDYPLPPETSANGWPLDFAELGSAFYRGAGVIYPAWVDLLTSEEFHRRYRLMGYPLDGRYSVGTFRRFPEGAIPPGEAWANLGWTLVGLGDVEKGLAILEFAARSAPDLLLARSRLDAARALATRRP
jgi:arabinofuranosyltransferase